MPGELHTLLERCRADDGAAWERFAGWVTTRGRTILGGVDRLSDADGEDAVEPIPQELMHRAFALDVLACANCGGRLRLIATLHDPVVIRKLLAHLNMARSGPSPGPP